MNDQAPPTSPSTDTPPTGPIAAEVIKADRNEAEDTIVTDAGLSSGAPAAKWLKGRLSQLNASMTTPASSGTPLAVDPMAGDVDLEPPASPWLRRLSWFVIAFAMVTLFWKLHAFKLPSQIAVEKAQAKSLPLPRLNLWRSIGDWLTPWRWGRGDMLKNTTATGGDMGAHVFTPDFVKRSLLPKARFTGWTDNYYAGMPVINFYFPLPTWIIVILSFVLPYNIAFKLVTVLGLITLPLAGYKSGRLMGLRNPVPTLMALAGVIFVLGRNYDLQIYGGNALATMAGEFSFSISVSCAVLFLGLWVRALRTGEGRGRAAAMLAITGLCHLLPTLWAVMVAFFLLLTHLDPKRVRPRNVSAAIASVGTIVIVGGLVAIIDTKPHGAMVLGGLLFALVIVDWFTNIIGFGEQLRDALLMVGFGGSLAGFWNVPFFFNLPYSNDMGWEKMTKYIANLFPFWAGKGAKPYADAGIMAVLMLLALIGAIGAWTSVVSALRRSVERRVGWSGSVLPLAVIAASIAGLIAALSSGNNWIGLAVAFAIIALTFIVYVALSDASIVWAAILILTVVIATPTILFAAANSWLTVAITGIVVALVVIVRTSLTGERFHRWPVALTLALATIATLFRYSPQFRLWNARALPFWFFSIGLLAAFGATEIPRWIGALVRRFAEPRRHVSGAPVLGTAVASLVTFVAVGLPLNLVPGNVPVPDVKAGRVGVQLAKKSNDQNPAPGWSGYNFAGYEARAWGEYKALMDTAARVGRERGCGRAMWEYDDARLNSYGTTLSLMLLPYWTKGCIGSMEAVYFESSATTPYHFLTAAYVTAPAVTNPDGSKKYSGPSNPQRFLRYPAVTVENYPQTFATGIKKLQGEAVRYYISLTDLSATTALAHPELTRVAESGPFSIFEIKNSDRVSPLTEEPVVVTGIDQDQEGGWLDVEQEWYLNEAGNYPTTIAWKGPKSWQRMAATVKKEKGVHTWGAGVSVTSTQRKPLPPVVVSDIKQNNTDISFTVDKVGLPVLVKTSYFRNWKVKGAKGPYRVMPNFMVVIPTKKNVHLHYGFSGPDKLGYAVSVFGIAGVVGLRRRRHRDRRPASVDAPPPSPAAEVSAPVAFPQTTLLRDSADAGDQRAGDQRAEDLGGSEGSDDGAIAPIEGSALSANEASLNEPLLNEPLLNEPLLNEPTEQRSDLGAESQAVRDTGDLDGSNVARPEHTDGGSA